MKRLIGLILILIGVFVVLLTIFSLLAKQGSATFCKHENAECYWNHSNNDCCAGLDCNYWKTTGGTRRYKCETKPTPTPTPVCKEEGRCDHDWQCCSGDCHRGECKEVKPTPTPTEEPEPTPTPTEEPEPTPTPTQEPTPTPEPPKNDGGGVGVATTPWQC